MRESLYVIAGPAVFLGVLYGLLCDFARFPAGVPEIPFLVYELLSYIVVGSAAFRASIDRSTLSTSDLKKSSTLGSRKSLELDGRRYIESRKLLIDLSNTYDFIHLEVS